MIKNILEVLDKWVEEEFIDEIYSWEDLKNFCEIPACPTRYSKIDVRLESIKKLAEDAFNSGKLCKERQSKLK